MESGSIAHMRTLLKCFTVVLVTVTCIFVARPTVAQTNRVVFEVRTLESLVTEWVRLRSQIATEARDWQEKKLHWMEEIRLLEAEKAELEKELAAADARVTSAEEKRADLIDSKQQKDGALTALEPVLDRAEAELRQWKARIPPSLRLALDPLFAQLSATPQPTASHDVSRRLQLVIALYTQIESLQHGIHVSREMLPIGNSGRREVDVLYTGLARGFAVSADDSEAAVGIPVEDGWRWQTRPALAPQIRKAIAVFNRETTAQFVALPLGVVPVADEESR